MLKKINIKSNNMENFGGLPIWAQWSTPGPDKQWALKGLTADHRPVYHEKTVYLSDLDKQ
jgi:hypothetical protein